MPLPPEMPPGTAMSLLGVDYFRLKTDDDGELFLTRFGLPFWKTSPAGKLVYQ